MPPSPTGSSWPLLLALVLLLLSLFVLWAAGRRQKALGLPAGRIIVVDTTGWLPVQQTFYDAATGLTGRPDYLVEQAGKLVPVEVKSGRAEAGPYDSHIFQLAAYCLLVERHYHQQPEFGILHYQNRTYAIAYTPQMETRLLMLMDEMRRMGTKKTVDRSHDSIQRCQRCGYRSICDQALL